MIELGMMITKNRTNYKERLKKSQNITLEIIREDPDTKGWWKSNQKLTDQMIGIPAADSMEKESLKTILSLGS